MNRGGLQLILQSKMDFPPAFNQLAKLGGPKLYKLFSF